MSADKLTIILLLNHKLLRVLTMAGLAEVFYPKF
jgi:hypothetical protein